MPLGIRPRKGRDGALTISGTLTLSDGSKVRVERRAQSDDPAIAAEEARNLEVKILRDDWYGERSGGRGLAAAVLAYINAHPEATDDTKARYNRVLRALGDVSVGSIGQETVTKLLNDGFLMAARHRQAVARAERLGLPHPPRPTPSPATITREIINPLRAACSMVGAHLKFVVPREHEGRTIYFMPEEAEAVIACANHLAPLLIFLGCTGVRLGEARGLRWDDRPAPIDLIGRRLLLFADQTKARKQRIVELTPRAVEVLRSLPHRSGSVFRRPDGEPYTSENRDPMKTAYAAALRRANLGPEFTKHVWRHTWATYHYALNKDPLKLMIDGGWSDLKLVTRYAHLMPAGCENDVRRFWGLRPTSDQRGYGDVNG